MQKIREIKMIIENKKKIQQRSSQAVLSQKKIIFNFNLRHRHYQVNRKSKRKD